MGSTAASGDTLTVVLLAEGVDRNLLFVSVRQFVEVALLAEGVDRNEQALVQLA